MVIYGASGHCKVIIDILEALNIPIEYIVDDNRSLTKLFNYNICPNKGTYDKIIIAIGDNATRKTIVSQIKANDYPVIAHPSAIISSRSTILDGTVIMQGAIIQSCANIGKFCIINTGASIDHECVIGNFCHISPHATLCGNVTVGNNSWIGAGAVIKQGITIGENTIIGAGSVVVDDIPSNVIAFGNKCIVRKKI